MTQMESYLQIFKIRALPTSAIIYKDLKIDNVIVGHISNGQIKDYYEGKGENEVMEESKNTTVNNVNKENIKEIYLAGGCFWGHREGVQGDTRSYRDDCWICEWKS